MGRKLRIRHHLDLYNQHALTAQSQFDKTFDGPTPYNLEVLKVNQERQLESARTQAEIIIGAIGDLRREYVTEGVG